MDLRTLPAALGACALLLVPVAPARAATPDCCFLPAQAISEPIPAGDVRVIDNAGMPLVARRARDGAIFTAGPLWEWPLTVRATFTWPYAQWWAGDVDYDDDVDLLGRDGTRIVAALGDGAQGFSAPRFWATLPRRFSVVRIGDLWGSDSDEADDLVALDPSSGELRWILSQWEYGPEYPRPIPHVEPPDVMGAGRWPRGVTFQLASVVFGQVDAIGVDPRTGRVRLAQEADARGGLSRDEPSYRIPPHATLAVGDVTGDGQGDLVYRPRGSDDVYVRRAYESPPQTDVKRISVHYRFHSARRWGRWDRRLPLTLAYVFDVRQSLVARDPATGRMLAARSTSLLGAP